MRSGRTAVLSVVGVQGVEVLAQAVARAIVARAESRGWCLLDAVRCPELYAGDRRGREGVMFPFWDAATAPPPIHPDPAPLDYF